MRAKIDAMKTEIDKLKKSRIAGHDIFFTDDVKRIDDLRKLTIGGMTDAEVALFQLGIDTCLDALEEKLKRKRLEINSAGLVAKVDRNIWRAF